MYTNQFNKPSFLTGGTNNTFGNGNGNGSPFGKNQFFGKPNGFAQTSSTFGQPANNTSIFSSMQPTNIFQTPSTSTFNAGPSAQTGFGSNLFGQQQQMPSGGLFGATSTFGQNKPAFGFGAPANQPGLFGQQPQQPQPGTSLFQPTAPNLFGASNAFGAQAQSGTVVKFNPVTGSDTMQKNGVAQTISTKHHCITCMKEYESKSLEELRLEDYMANRKGPQQQSGFAAPAFGGPTASSAPPLFGQGDAKAAFGQAPGFGQPTSTFGQSTTGFGLGNQPSTSNLFGKPSGFGAPTSSTSAFGFNSTAAPSNPFSANQQTKPFPQQSLFGTNTAQPQQSGFGTNVFGQTANQNTTANLFQKPAQPATGFNANQTGFTFNQPVATSQAPNLFQVSKPNTSFGLFGQTNTGTTPFGQTTQSTFGAPTFGKPITSGFGQPPTQPPFGASLVSIQQQQQQQQTGSLFAPNTAKPPNIFGTPNAGSNLFGNNVFQSTQAPFTLTNQQQQAQFPPDHSHDSLAMSAIMTDIYPNGPHVKLDPVFSETFSSTTNKKELQAILDLNKAPDDPPSTRSKIMVQQPKPKRGIHFNKEFFETTRPIKGSCKRLVIKQTSSDSSNIFNKYRNELLEEADKILNALSSPNDDGVEEMSTTSLPSPPIPPPPPPIPIPPVETPTKAPLNAPQTSSVVPRTLKVRFAPPTMSDDVSGSESDSAISIKGHFIGSTRDDLTESDVNTNPEVDDDDDDEIIIDGQSREVSCTSSETDLGRNPAGVILTKPEYYIIPPLNKLHEFMNEKGECLVQGLTIGRKGYGNVHFPDQIDIKNLNVDEVVYFRHKEIIVYPDNDKKPPFGDGLNRRAQVTLDKVYPRLKGTNRYVTNVSEIVDSGFVDNLMRVTQRHNCKFVEYRPKTGSWVFKVNHFSKYGLTDSDEEECEISLDALEKKHQEMKDKRMEEYEEMQKFGGLGGQLLTKARGRSQDHSLEKSFLENVDERWADERHIGYLEEEYQQKANVQAMKLAFFQEQIYPTGPPSKISDGPIRTDTKRAFDVIATPKIYTLALFKKKDLPKLTKLGQRVYADLCMFKGGAFKPSWMHGCEFFQLKREYDVHFYYELNRTRIHTTGYPEFHIMMPSLVDVLKIALEESIFEFSNKSVPTLRIRKGRSYLNRQCALFKNYADSNRFVGDLKYLSNIWTLCAALWGDDVDNSTFERRQAVSAWLKDALYNDQVDELTFRSNLTKHEAIDAIFTLLTYNKVNEAAKLATENNLGNLSLLISQLSANEFVKYSIKKYTQSYEWEEKVPDSFKRIYMLLAGTPTLQNMNICREIDWKRTFGLHLWYISPVACPIFYALNLYQKAFEELGYASSPKPPYCDEHSECSDYDLLYQILLLYCKANTHQLCYVLNPTTHTDNSMDYRISWALLLLFQSLEVGLTDEHQENCIHTTFSNQLEHMGLWKWAIFVLLYLKNNLQKRILITRILERHLNDDTGNCEKELITVMKIPPLWIHSVKGEKMLFHKRYFDAFQHYLEIKDWDQVSMIFVNHILPKLYINEQYDYLRQFIRLVEPSSSTLLQWKYQAGLFKDYFDVKDYIAHGSVHNSNLVITKFNSICQRLKKFPVDNEQQKVCIAELSRGCAFIFKVLLKKFDMTQCQGRTVDFSDNLIMPPDYKHYELFYDIFEYLNQ